MTRGRRPADADWLERCGWMASPQRPCWRRHPLTPWLVVDCGAEPTALRIGDAAGGYRTVLFVPSRERIAQIAAALNLPIAAEPLDD